MLGNSGGTTLYRTVEQIIATTKQKESKDLAKAQAVIGDICDAWRGFIEISTEWKIAFDKAFNVDINDTRENLFTARAVSLSVLTTRILARAREMPKLLSAGAIESMVVNWRYISETKIIAMMIDMDVFGPAGFLWLHRGMIDQAKVGGPGDDSRKFAKQSKQILEEAGFEYDKDAKDPWSKGIDKGQYKDAVARSQYVWRLRKFPAQFTKGERSYLAEAEQQLIRVSNSFAQPSLVPQEKVKDSLHTLMLSAILDPMAVMLAYKVAASDVAGWPYTKTVGEQFHVYPSGEEQSKGLSFMVAEMHDHCLKAFREQFIEA